MAISGAGKLSRKSFDYEQFVKDTPSTTTPINRTLKTEWSMMVFMNKSLKNMHKIKETYQRKIRRDHMKTAKQATDAILLNLTGWKTIK